MLVVVFYVICHIVYSVIDYLNVRFGGLVTSVGKERAIVFSAIDYP